MNTCNCFSERLDLAKKRIESKLPSGSDYIKIKYRDEVYFFSGDFSPVNPVIEISYKLKKKDGTMAKNSTKDSVSMLADFCCFCGRKLDKQDKEEADNCDV